MCIQKVAQKNFLSSSCLKRELITSREMKETRRKCVKNTFGLARYIISHCITRYSISQCHHSCVCTVHRFKSSGHFLLHGTNINHGQTRNITDQCTTPSANSDVEISTPWNLKLVL